MFVYIEKQQLTGTSYLRYLLYLSKWN